MIDHSATTWAVIGIVLIIAEVITTNFVLIFFGVAALIVAAVKLAGLDNLPFELGLFAALGLVDLLLLRKKLVASFLTKGKIAGDTTNYVTLSVDVPPQGEAPVQYQGALWTAVNESAQSVAKGEKVMIVRTEGIKLIIAPSTHKL